MTLGRVLGLQIDPVHLDGDLVEEPDTTRTEAMVLLLTDARVSAEELPPGVANRGYWADAFATDGQQLGSNLWLQTERPSDSTTQRADAVTAVVLALAPLVTSGRVSRTEVSSAPSDTHVDVRVVLVKQHDDRVELDPIRVN